jgi:hypothetical protein
MQRDAFFQKLERHVGDLFEEVRQKAEAAGEKFAIVPYLGDSFPIECAWLFRLKRQVARALVARKLFEQHAPPELPLSNTDIEKAIRSKDNRIVLIGFFARSWACANWGAHPSFIDYSSAVMTSEHAPQHLRTDAALLKKFPPRPLKGLDRNLCWGTFDRIFDFAQQLTRNEEIWRRCGRVSDAQRARGILRLIGGERQDLALLDFLETQ